jgi:dihydroorotate dehydrogenase
LFENEHFTFLYYGGKNLSHFTADKELEDGLINVLLTNRNAIIVMDHDEDSEEQDIRKTKQRIKKEFEEKNMYVWITEGKEIENYIFVSDIKTAYNDFGEKAKIKEQVEAFEKFSDYIKLLVNNFSSQKVSFAHKINFTSDSLKIMDLEKRIDTIAGIIKKWNNI